MWLFSSSLSAIIVVSSAYLKLLIFLPAILIPIWDSSSTMFGMMYSAYRLNRQDDNTQPCCTLLSVLNQSVVPYLVLIVAPWIAYRFCRRQERWCDIPISLGIFHSLSQSTQSKALEEPRKQKYMFFWNCLPFSKIQQILAIWSLVPLPLWNPACTSGSSQFMYCWSLTWRILRIILLAFEMSAIVW